MTLLFLLHNFCLVAIFLKTCLYRNSTFFCRVCQKNIKPSVCHDAHIVAASETLRHGCVHIPVVFRRYLDVKKNTFHEIPLLCTFISLYQGNKGFLLQNSGILAVSLFFQCLHVSLGTEHRILNQIADYGKEVGLPQSHFFPA